MHCLLCLLQHGLPAVLLAPQHAAASVCAHTPLLNALFRTLVRAIASVLMAASCCGAKLMESEESEERVQAGEVSCDCKF